MSSFNQDEKWMEAKKVVGDLDWLDIISYYRAIGGKNVFVYAIGDGDKKLIVDYIDGNHILLVNKEGDLVLERPEDVRDSRKAFSYSDEYEEREFYLGNRKLVVPIEVT